LFPTLLFLTLLLTLLFLSRGRLSRLWGGRCAALSV
jgi:hypothetical protein